MEGVAAPVAVLTDDPPGGLLAHYRGDAVERHFCAIGKTANQLNLRHFLRNSTILFREQQNLEVLESLIC